MTRRKKKKALPNSLRSKIKKASIMMTTTRRVKRSLRRLRKNLLCNLFSLKNQLKSLTLKLRRLRFKIVSLKMA